MYSWFVTTEKGVQLAMADGHAVWTTTDYLYDKNLLKYDCQRSANDVQTWPSNAYVASTCGGYDAATCVSRAKQLVAAEHL